MSVPTTDEYQQLLSVLHDRDPHNRDIQYAAAALIRADRDGTEALAVNLAQMSRKALPADIAAELRSHPSAQVRARAWSGTGATAPAAEWDRALAEETDTDVREIMQAVAPVDQFPDARMWALLGAKREKFTVPSARALVEVVGRAEGAERWWPAALSALNPNTLPQATLEDIEASLTLGYASTEVLAEKSVPWLFRVFAALAPTAPVDTLAQLAAEADGVKLQEKASAVLRNALHAAASSSMTDRAGLEQLCEAATGVVNRPRDLMPATFAEVTGMSTADTYRHLLEAASKIPGTVEARTRRSLRLWRSLPAAERTDDLCAHTIFTFAYAHHVCTEVLDFLGDRATEVLEAAGIVKAFAHYTSPEPERWVYTAAPHVFVTRVRSRNSWGDAMRYRHQHALADHPNLRDLVWADLVENPQEWDERAAAYVLQELPDLTDEQWLQLPANILIATINMSGFTGGAFASVSSALARTLSAPAGTGTNVPEPSLATVSNADVARTSALQHLCGSTVPLGSALTAAAAVA